MLAKDAGAAYDVDGRGCATLPKSGLAACFDDHGVRFSGADVLLALRLVGFGRSGDVTPVAPVRPAIAGNRVRYVHGALSEWWRVLPTGFEQGFTIAKRPGGRGWLLLTLSTTRQSRESGNPVRTVGTSLSIPLRPEAGKEIASGKLRYGGLVVADAKGKIIPATLRSAGDRIRIAVNDAGAAYPLTVDPMVWLEQKATASDGAVGDSLGYSVAISGTIALVGAPGATVNGNASQGAAYVFTEAGGSWIQSAKL
ncbi:MAG TPA: FG-GAP repeat protein, partial [Gammaproteobacteria bacterium]|nr:FG-GAP repeat protein [Gammaproteobacteria bacterium]